MGNCCLNTTEYEIWMIKPEDQQLTFITVHKDNVDPSVFRSGNMYVINENRQRLWLWFGKHTTPKIPSSVWDMGKKQQSCFKQSISVTVVKENQHCSTFEAICLKKNEET